MTGTSTVGPLTGLRIIDLTSVIMGPYATSLLADQGADVIIVEDAEGDSNRVMGHGPAAQLSDISLNLLRNKRSVCLDLKSDEGREYMLRLIRTADAFVTTLRPGSLERLGLDYESIAALREDIVYCQAQGWPSGDVSENRPAYDDIVQAATGFTDVMFRHTGQHLFVPSIIVDKTCGALLAQSVTAALLHRVRFGEGQRVELSMIEAMTQFLLIEHGSGGITAPPAEDIGYQRVISSERRPYTTSDGVVQVMPYSPRQFATLLVALGVDAREVEEDARLTDQRTTIAHTGTLYRDIRALIAHRSTAWVIEFCAEADIPATPIMTLEERIDTLPVVTHPFVGPYRLLPHPARFFSTPTGLRHHAPLIGADTESILAETEEQR